MPGPGPVGGEKWAWERVRARQDQITGGLLGLGRELDFVLTWWEAAGGLDLIYILNLSGWLLQRE